MRWGVLNPEGDEITPTGSYAQAWALATTWEGGHPDPAVIVAQPAPDADWATRDGLTYSDPRIVGGPRDEDDMMADPVNAALWLDAVRRLTATAAAPSAVVHLATLEHEAVAHGTLPEED